MDYQGTLWAHDGTQWVSSKDTLIKASDGTAFLTPWIVEATDGTDWWVCYPLYVPPAIPGPVLNLHATVVGTTSITVAWDAHTDPTVTSYRYVMRGVVDQNVGTATARLQSGLTANTTYTMDVYALNVSGSSVAATISVKTGGNPPTITTWSGVTYSQINLTTTGDSPQSLNSVGGYRNGQTWGWNAGANVIGGCSGTEYWTVSNAAGVTGRFYTVAGTPYVPGTTGSINNTLAAPTAAFGRGSSYGVDWGVPAMAAHANFPYSNINDGTGASRFQTGNYPRGWVQFQIGVEANYRVRRFFFAQGDGAGNTEVVTPTYSLNNGASFKRWTHGFQVWIDVVDPSATSPNGLLSISSDGNWDRDWNWRTTSSGAIATPYVDENAQDLPQQWVYVRWGIVHLAGSFGANIGECWMEYQTPSYPARAEVMCGVAWG